MPHAFEHSEAPRGPHVYDGWMARDPQYGEVKSIYCPDNDSLVCPSSLLASDMKGRQFKSVIADLNDTQRRLLRRMMATKEKLAHLDQFTAQLQEMEEQAVHEHSTSVHAIDEVIAGLQRSLHKAAAEMRDCADHVKHSNLDMVREKQRFCAMLRSDMVEGIALAKDLVSTDQAHTQPLSVVSSIESGLDELNAAHVGPLPACEPQQRAVDCAVAVAGLNDMVHRFAHPAGAQSRAQHVPQPAISGGWPRTSAHRYGPQ
eukprot:TRINITY_DN27038_c0_g1_i1.p1 TRINITY_DN27038_c0_g1~~TRINITY_DN27038_c0_g1_i1.p1  ORF type:complete len:259 (+),score=81.88 TRINITY_DN27038_c0_g1_i1:65-841(+)